MNTVLFDLLYAQPLNGTRFHGGGEYIKSVFQALAEQYDGQYTLEVCFDPEAFLDQWILDIIGEKKIRVHSVKSAQEICEVLKSYREKNTVRFFTGMIYQYSEVDFPAGVVKIGVCHGLRGIEKPYDGYALRFRASLNDWKDCIRNTILHQRTERNLMRYFSRLIEKFDLVITDSLHSAYSIKVNLPATAKQKEIRVFYAPSKVSVMEAENAVACEPFILMISANRWLKNGYRGAMAIDQLYQKGYLQGVKTRIYGGLPQRIRKRLACKENFIFYDYVSTEELEAAYRDCAVFFYPTLNEGFGLPPMEATKYGKTCVISGVCSLPEIYGDAVYYCNPYDMMEMQNQILHAVETKIPSDLIATQFRKIKSKQDTDLLHLCDLIINGVR